MEACDPHSADQFDQQIREAEALRERIEESGFEQLVF
jgi:hypothetical protein